MEISGIEFVFDHRFDGGVNFLFEDGSPIDALEPGVAFDVSGVLSAESLGWLFDETLIRKPF